MMLAEFDRAPESWWSTGLNALPGVSCIVPKGAFYAFPNISQTGWKAKKLASALLEDAGVATIGGPDFGVHGEGYIRLSYANSLENIERALERMGDVPHEREGRLTRPGTSRTFRGAASQIAAAETTQQAIASRKAGR